MPTGVYERTKPIWNKGLTKETDGRMKKTSVTLTGRKRPKEVAKRISEKLTGRKLSDEHKDNIKEGMKKVDLRKENSPVWKGGWGGYWHDKAWELFGLPYCEECGMTNEEHIERKGVRLSMHNKLEPKDYKIMKEEVWVAVCEYGCHQKLEREI